MLGALIRFSCLFLAVSALYTQALNIRQMFDVSPARRAPSFDAAEEGKVPLERLTVEAEIPRETDNMPRYIENPFVSPLIQRWRGRRFGAARRRY
ncbi:unnamed protein product, partial [Mesorhabditis spiculigera]